tara:strand:- start:98265 stop:98789 length:525 start_codon:yes stop_codon:yes gene_type:complete
MPKKITPSDSDLFRQAIDGVQRLDDGKHHHRPKPKPLRKREADDTPQLNTIYTQEQTVEATEQLFFARGGLQTRLIKQLRQGKLPCEAECDLHGLIQVQASKVLHDFIHESRQFGNRFVRVVHGKGHRSQDGQPKLKNLVNNELRSYSDVLAFCSAQPKHGGTGAVYVILKLAD